MTLRAKTLLVTAVVLATLFVALFGFVYLITARSFGAVEERSGMEQLDRVEAALKTEHEQLVSITGDWAHWDDAYRFMQDRNGRFVEDNLTGSALSNIRAEVMIFLDRSGRIVHASSFDIDTGEPREVSRRLLDEIEAHPTEYMSAGQLEQRHGLVITPDGPLPFASESILRSDMSGPPAGTLIIGRYLDRGELDRLEKRTRTSLDLFPLSTGEKLPSDVMSAVKDMDAAGKGRIVRPVDADTLASYAVYPDVHGDPAMVIRALSERVVFAQGRLALSRFGLAILGVGLALMVLNLALLDRSVLAPIARLSRSVREIESSGDVKSRVPVRGSDELAGMASDINGMLSALERAQLDIAEAREDLERRVELRTAELAEANETLIAEIEERRRAEAQLAFLASHDYLTGLFGRRRFEEELDIELARALRAGDRGAVLWLDLDHFKEINDSLGHSVGDEMLRGIAGLLRESLRSYSSVARLGGDEFAVVLSGVDAEQAMSVANRLVGEVAHQQFLIGGHNLRATVSVGAVLYPEHGTTTQELLARADLAMYHAKREGRGRACLYEPGAEWHAELAARLSWAERIDEALAERRFAAWAQPVFDVRSGKVARHELLLRMIGPGGEVVQPSEFLSAAERLGRINAIDRWMVERAIRALGDPAYRSLALELDVNLSGRAFADAELLPLIEELLARWEVDPRRLGLEITETAAIVDLAKAQEFIERLRSLGCRFALDDFGAGFSSFYYLKQLPVDCLKIDGSFVRGLAESDQDQHLVRAIVELGRGLGIITAAEYVEDAETLGLLRRYGVDLAQGFYLGRPRPLEEILADPATGAAAG